MTGNRGGMEDTPASSSDVLHLQQGRDRHVDREKERRLRHEQQPQLEPQPKRQPQPEQRRTRALQQRECTKEWTKDKRSLQSRQLGRNKSQAQCKSAGGDAGTNAGQNRLDDMPRLRHKKPVKPYSYASTSSVGQNTETLLSQESSRVRKIDKIGAEVAKFVKTSKTSMTSLRRHFSSMSLKDKQSFRLHLSLWFPKILRRPTLKGIQEALMQMKAYLFNRVFRIQFIDLNQRLSESKAQRALFRKERCHDLKCASAPDNLFHDCQKHRNSLRADVKPCTRTMTAENALKKICYHNSVPGTWKNDLVDTEKWRGLGFKSVDHKTTKDAFGDLKFIAHVKDIQDAETNILAAVTRKPYLIPEWLKALLQEEFVVNLDMGIERKPHPLWECLEFPRRLSVAVLPDCINSASVNGHLFVYVKEQEVKPSSFLAESPNFRQFPLMNSAPKEENLTQRKHQSVVLGHNSVVSDDFQGQSDGVALSLSKASPERPLSAIWFPEERTLSFAYNWRQLTHQPYFKEKSCRPALAFGNRTNHGCQFWKRLGCKRVAKRYPSLSSATVLESHDSYRLHTTESKSARTVTTYADNSKRGQTGKGKVKSFVWPRPREIKVFFINKCRRLFKKMASTACEKSRNVSEEKTAIHKNEMSDNSNSILQTRELGGRIDLNQTWCNNKNSVKVWPFKTLTVPWKTSQRVLPVARSANLVSNEMTKGAFSLPLKGHGEVQEVKVHSKKVRPSRRRQREAGIENGLDRSNSSLHSLVYEGYQEAFVDNFVEVHRRIDASTSTSNLQLKPRKAKAAKTATTELILRSKSSKRNCSEPHDISQDSNADVQPVSQNAIPCIDQHYTGSRASKRERCITKVVGRRSPTAMPQSDNGFLSGSASRQKEKYYILSMKTKLTESNRQTLADFVKEKWRCDDEARHHPPSVRTRSPSRVQKVVSTASVYPSARQNPRPDQDLVVLKLPGRMNVLCSESTIIPKQHQHQNTARPPHGERSYEKMCAQRRENYHELCKTLDHYYSSLSSGKACGSMSALSAELMEADIKFWDELPQEKVRYGRVLASTAPVSNGKAPTDPSRELQDVGLLYLHQMLPLVFKPIRHTKQTQTSPLTNATTAPRAISFSEKKTKQLPSHEADLRNALNSMLSAMDKLVPDYFAAGFKELEQSEVNEGEGDRPKKMENRASSENKKEPMYRNWQFIAQPVTPSPSRRQRYTEPAAKNLDETTNTTSEPAGSHEVRNTSVNNVGEATPMADLPKKLDRQFVNNDYDRARPPLLEANVDERRPPYSVSPQSQLKPNEGGKEFGFPVSKGSSEAAPQILLASNRWSLPLDPGNADILAARLQGPTFLPRDVKQTKEPEMISEYGQTSNAREPWPSLSSQTPLGFLRREVGTMFPSRSLVSLGLQTSPRLSAEAVGAGNDIDQLSPRGTDTGMHCPTLAHSSGYNRSHTSSPHCFPRTSSILPCLGYDCKTSDIEQALCTHQSTKLNAQPVYPFSCGKHSKRQPYSTALDVQEGCWLPSRPATKTTCQKETHLGGTENHYGWRSSYSGRCCQAPQELSNQSTPSIEQTVQDILCKIYMNFPHKELADACNKKSVQQNQLKSQEVADVNSGQEHCHAANYLRASEKSPNDTLFISPKYLAQQRYQNNCLQSGANSSALNSNLVQGYRDDGNLINPPLIPKLTEKTTFVDRMCRGSQMHPGAVKYYKVYSAERESFKKELERSGGLPNSPSISPDSSVLFKTYEQDVHKMGNSHSAATNKCTEQVIQTDVNSGLSKMRMYSKGLHVNPFKDLYSQDSIGGLAPAEKGIKNVRVNASAQTCACISKRHGHCHCGCILDNSTYDESETSKIAPHNAGEDFKQRLKCRSAWVQTSQSEGPSRRQEHLAKPCQKIGTKTAVCCKSEQTTSYKTGHGDKNCQVGSSVPNGDTSYSVATHPLGPASSPEPEFSSEDQNCGVKKSKIPVKISESRCNRRKGINKKGPCLHRRKGDRATETGHKQPFAAPCSQKYASREAKDPEVTCDRGKLLYTDESDLCGKKWETDCPCLAAKTPIQSERLRPCDYSDREQGPNFEPKRQTRCDGDIQDDTKSFRDCACNDEDTQVDAGRRPIIHIRYASKIKGGENQKPSASVSGVMAIHDDLKCQISEILRRSKILQQQAVALRKQCRSAGIQRAPGREPVGTSRSEYTSCLSDVANWDRETNATTNSSMANRNANANPHCHLSDDDKLATCFSGHIKPASLATKDGTPAETKLAKDDLLTTLHTSCTQQNYDDAAMTSALFNERIPLSLLPCQLHHKKRLGSTNVLVDEIEKTVPGDTDTDNIELSGQRVKCPVQGTAIVRNDDSKSQVVRFHGRGQSRNAGHAQKSHCHRDIESPELSHGYTGSQNPGLFINDPSEEAYQYIEAHFPRIARSYMFRDTSPCGLEPDEAVSNREKDKNESGRQKTFEREEMMGSMQRCQYSEEVLPAACPTALKRGQRISDTDNALGRNCGNGLPDVSKEILSSRRKADCLASPLGDPSFGHCPKTCESKVRPDHLNSRNAIASCLVSVPSLPTRESLGKDYWNLAFTVGSLCPAPRDKKDCLGMAGDEDKWASTRVLLTNRAHSHYRGNTTIVEDTSDLSSRRDTVKCTRTVGTSVQFSDEFKPRKKRNVTIIEDFSNLYSSSSSSLKSVKSHTVPTALFRANANEEGESHFQAARSSFRTVEVAELSLPGATSSFFATSDEKPLDHSALRQDRTEIQGQLTTPATQSCRPMNSKVTGSAHCGPPSRTIQNQSSETDDTINHDLDARKSTWLEKGHQGPSKTTLSVTEDHTQCGSLADSKTCLLHSGSDEASSHGIEELPLDSSSTTGENRVRNGARANSKRRPSQTVQEVSKSIATSRDCNLFARQLPCTQKGTAQQANPLTLSDSLNSETTAPPVVPRPWLHTPQMLKGVIEVTDNPLSAFRQTGKISSERFQLRATSTSLKHSQTSGSQAPVTSGAMKSQLPQLIDGKKTVPMWNFSSRLSQRRILPQTSWNRSLSDVRKKSHPYAVYTRLSPNDFTPLVPTTESLSSTHRRGNPRELRDWGRKMARRKLKAKSKPEDNFDPDIKASVADAKSAQTAFHNALSHSAPTSSHLLDTSPLQGPAPRDGDSESALTWQTCLLACAEVTEAKQDRVVIEGAYVRKLKSCDPVADSPSSPRTPSANVSGGRLVIENCDILPFKLELRKVATGKESRSLLGTYIRRLLTLDELFSWRANVECNM